LRGGKEKNDGARNLQLQRLLILQAEGGKSEVEVQKRDHAREETTREASRDSEREPGKTFGKGEPRPGNFNGGYFREKEKSRVRLVNRQKVRGEINVKIKENRESTRL